MDELLAQFRIEAPELAQQAGDALLALERDPADRERLAEAFRAIHTLKGSVALFDMAPLGAALHAAEDVLGAVRAGRRTLDTRAHDLLIGLVGEVEGCVEAAEAGSAMPAAASDACARATAGLRGWLDEPTEPLAPERVAAPDWALDLIRGHADSLAGDGPLVAIRYTPHRDCFFRGDDPLALVREVPDLLALELSPREPWPSAEAFDPFRCNLVITALAGGSVESARALFRLVADQVTLVEVPREAPAPEPAAAVVEPVRDPAGRSLRVDPARVDELLNVVGELVVASNALAHLASGAQGGLGRDLGAHQQGLSRLVGSLHGAVMRVRLTPLSRTFERLPRLVREVSSRLGKAVRFEMEGQGIEADRAVVDGQYEPLLHLLRNAVDHGVEPADVRLAAGKPAQGEIRVRAVREGQNLMVEVSDDGGGIDPERVRRIARERGILSPSAAEALTDAAVAELIFAPGFSTASSVSDISGRGVGLDSVRDAVERLGGRLTVANAPGRGATMRMLLPVSAVLTRVLVVRVGSELYGAPMDVVLETLRLPAERLLAVGAGQAMVLRDRTVPVLRLGDLLGMERVQVESEDLKVLVVRAAGGEVGIVVDAFAEQIEVMLRSMAGLLSGLPGVLGSTLLGDGRVLLVLDLPELIG